MKSVRLHGTGDLRIHDEPNPLVGEGDKLIRVKSVGVCGSDLHWFSEGEIGDAKLERPLVLGHEFAGETEDGQRVAIDPAIACGHCEYCEHGHPNLCSDMFFAGHGGTDGALREYMAWPEKCLFSIPDSFTDAEGNLWMAYHAWTGADVGYPQGKRSLHLDLVTFEGDTPVTNGPTYAPQLLP